MLGKSLFIADPRVRELVEQVKNENGFKSLRDTVEKGMLLLQEQKRNEPSIDDKIKAIQKRFRTRVRKNNPHWSEEEKKVFFDDLSGGA
ncbi:hypothetical protein [Bartonella queenslandensis]|uniref:hypothetical protein n=1 Tax=Bartonella queenslandensis TaxID=481138 RepID=UPI0003060E5D|nr:hypothetical protein [Bartonella queenslandensis]